MEAERIAGGEPGQETLAALLADYPVHRRYLECAEGIAGATRTLEHLTEQGVILCRPTLTPFADTLAAEGNGFWFDAELYDGGRVSGRHVLAAFGIDYDAFMREKEAMLEAAERAVRDGACVDTEAALSACF